MRSRLALPLFLTIALGMMALVATSPSPARASGIRTDVIDTMITGGSEADFPLSVEMNYEAGSTKIIYTRDGEFSFEADRTLGNFTGVTIYGTRMPVEHGGSAAIPGTERRITVSFSTSTESDGRAHTLVTMKIG
jgi:hypothetical protein